MMLRRACSAALLALTPLSAAVAAACGPVDWPLWAQFKTHFIQDSGRVLDASTPQQHTSSEGQSYGMFFALLANDRPMFDKLWAWSVDNLGGGDLSKRLPAWIWGSDGKGGWTVLDANSASDADVWFVYALLEAGRLWGDDAYTQRAQALLALIEAQEVADLPDLGPLLLPGRESFVRPGNVWQFNASYLPIPLLRRLAQASSHPAWKAMPETTLRFLQEASPKGFAADWNMYAPSKGAYAFVTDTLKGPVGSYDAIRTYMWAGMMPAGDPLAAKTLQALGGMAAVMAEQQRVVPPESVNTETAAVKGEGPFGFSAALVPYFSALGQRDQTQWQTERVNVALREVFQPLRTQQKQPPYYDVVLSLFGMGWAQGYYTFNEAGQLQTQWEKACLPARKN
ncbi:MAG TPA: cellulose synthase complex periplasmic endoglucanase BcsZ [Alcaligenes sp.]|nr:cellulose synthase complex periplasmic endoglucanase BcsZ [Alcaligenes sp.]HRL27344.1 cellulose synthase complex periplasmic endoglucanase BcsZ [Alcaligenes sp.]